MTLDQITPHPISSVLFRNWKADAPSYVVMAAIILPSLIFDWSHKWLFFVVGIVAGIAADAGMSTLRQNLRIKDARTPPASFPEPPQIDIIARANKWRALLGNDSIKSFVLFSYGTCVVSIDAAGDPVELAKALLQRFGHCVPGTESADMLVYELPDTGDFVIGRHHPNILTFVTRDMISASVPTDQMHTVAAFRGRDLRVFDTFALHPVHTEILDREV